MKRINLYLDEEQINFLKNRRGSISEHVRWALENYIHFIQKEEQKLVSASQSKEGD